MLSTKPPPLPPQATTKALLPVLASSIKVQGEAALKTTSKFWEASKNSSKVKTKKIAKKHSMYFFSFLRLTTFGQPPADSWEAPPPPCCCTPSTS